MIAVVSRAVGCGNKVNRPASTAANLCSRWLFQPVYIVHGDVGNGGLICAGHNLCAVIEDDYDGVGIELRNNKGRRDVESLS